MNSEPNDSKIKVLIVDDSAFMRMALSRIITHDPDFWVVGTATCGTEALQKIVTLDPDVITLDVEMPGLNGLETLRRIMAQFPRPVIMVSSATLESAEITFNALAAGAFDYVPKELSSTSLDILHIGKDLVGKIKAAAESRYRFDSCGSLPGRRRCPRGQFCIRLPRLLHSGSQPEVLRHCRKCSRLFPPTLQCQF
jgi:chemotaxis response regulator CheB